MGGIIAQLAETGGCNENAENFLGESAKQGETLFLSVFSVNSVA
jgi:hypothetical protein